MSIQGRTSDQTELTPKNDPQTAPKDAGEGTNLLQRWVRLVQSAGLYGNEAGAVRLDELAHGPTTPRFQTLTEIRAARAAAVAEEEAAGSPWWEDAIGAEDEPVRSELPPLYPMPPLVAPPVPPALPAVGEGLLSRILSYGARWLGPVVAGMWPKDTAPPELTDQPYTGMDPEVWPDAAAWPQKDQNKCRKVAIPHKGGNAFHDMCADTLPGNTIPERDLWVIPRGEKGLTFDAWSEALNRVWEVKTDDLTGDTAWLKRRRVANQVGPFLEQNRVAKECGLGFTVSVSDPEHYRLLKELLEPEGIHVEHREDCPNEVRAHEDEF